MRFSVIIPTFKRAQLLGDAIRAALAQSHPNREILIVDDGSPDDTRNVASTFGDAVRYRQENKGKSAALNLGISASTGDAIIVLDDDDLFPPWTVAKHAEALERNAAADAGDLVAGETRGGLLQQRKLRREPRSSASAAGRSALAECLRARGWMGSVAGGEALKR